MLPAAATPVGVLEDRDGGKRRPARAVAVAFVRRQRGVRSGLALWVGGGTGRLLLIGITATCVAVTFRLGLMQVLARLTCLFAATTSWIAVGAFGVRPADLALLSAWPRSPSPRPARLPAGPDSRSGSSSSAWS